jgi:hypothetical protein
MLSRPSNLKIWASKIYSVEANFKNFKWPKLFSLKDTGIDVISTLSCSTCHHVLIKKNFTTFMLE